MVVVPKKTGSRVSHPKGAPTSRDDTVWGRAGCVSGLGCRSPFGRGNGVACLEETSGLCGKRTLPPQRGPRLLVMTQDIAWRTCFGGPFHLATFPPQKHLSNFPRSFHSTYIYGGRLVLICISLTDSGLPGVILNLVRDDLRMMAPNAGAAKEGGMKHYADCIELIMRLSSN